MSFGGKFCWSTSFSDVRIEGIEIELSKSLGAALVDLLFGSRIHLGDWGSDNVIAMVVSHVIGYIIFVDIIFHGMLKKNNLFKFYYFLSMVCYYKYRGCAREGF